MGRDERTYPLTAAKVLVEVVLKVEAVVVVVVVVAVIRRGVEINYVLRVRFIGPTGHHTGLNARSHGCTTRVDARTRRRDEDDDNAHSPHPLVRDAYRCARSSHLRRSQPYRAPSPRHSSPTDPPSPRSTASYDNLRSTRKCYEDDGYLRRGGWGTFRPSCDII